MSEQTKQDWKEERIAEYARLGQQINIVTHNLVTDSVRNRLIKEEQKLAVERKQLEENYLKNIRAAQEQQAGIKLELAEKWDIEEKSFECASGTATLRTTKSLKIQNKEKLIDFLVLNKKLVDFIKSFEITKLRKIKDADLLGDEIASYDEKKSVAIKIAEGEQ